MTKIIDTFLFSEPHEKEVLLIKFIVGSDYITEWVIVENEYTFQGEYKGVFAQQVLDSDERFAPFRDRIHLISASLQYPAIDYTRKDIDTQGMASERRQRSLAQKYIVEKYGHESDVWVLLSDTDEVIDFDSFSDNFTFLTTQLTAANDGLVQVPRRRFWYDYDNLWNAVRATPIVTVQRLAQATGNMGMGLLRSDYIGAVTEWERTLVFEYSYCYRREHILRKFRTFPHGGMTDEEITQSMRCNHIPISKFRNKKLDLHKELWMEKVALTPHNSPRYVQENFTTLRTNIIDEMYVANRKIDYPHLYSLSHRVGFWVKQLGKKIVQTLK